MKTVIVIASCLLLVGCAGSGGILTRIKSVPPEKLWFCHNIFDPAIPGSTELKLDQFVSCLLAQPLPKDLLPPDPG